MSDQGRAVVAEIKIQYYMQDVDEKHVDLVLQHPEMFGDAVETIKSATEELSSKLTVGLSQLKRELNDDFDADGINVDVSVNLPMERKINEMTD